VAVRTPGAGLPARPRLLAPVSVVAAQVLVLGGVGIALFTDLLWFRSVGFSEVFATVLQTKLLLFVSFGLLMALLVGANIAIAYRVRPPFRPMSLEQQNLERYRVAVEPYLVPVLLLASGVFGLFAGLSAASRWQVWLLWRNATSFGKTDAQFGKDISYFAMTYPFQRFLLGFVLTAVVLSLLAAAATHYLFGGLRLQTAGDKVSPAARAHLSVLLGVVVLLKAVGYYLDRFGLAFSSRGRVQGASYTDVNAVLPAKSILVGIAVICALLFFANIVVRNILLPAGALALLVISAVVIGGVYPAYTQQFRVKPNELQREGKYIDRNIAATREAYQIDDVTTTQYDATSTATAAQLRAEPGTVPKIRLLDPNVLSDTFRTFQGLRSYYAFNESLDIDRYDIGEGLQDYVVAVRELNTQGLRDDQRNWINEHLVYTHGNGIVAAPANQVDAQGQPNFVVKDLPVESPKQLPVTEPRIYFGEGTQDYSVVKTQQDESDGPVGGSGEAKYTYTGNGGVQLSGAARKLAFAIKFREKNLLLSGALTKDSRILYTREPRERVQKVAPFLKLDGDPYPAVVDGKIIWIIDGYTTSAGYPYSQRTTLGAATLDSQTRSGARLPDQQVNYIRNSVKATVDAFTGKVTLYQWDTEDPVLKTWSKAFKGTITPKTEIPASLVAHFRYPEDLFKVQRDLLGRYHLVKANDFFRGEDYWQVPGDPSTGREAGTTATGAQAAAQLFNNETGAPDQPPYYVVQQFPGTDRPSFSLTTAFVAQRRPNLTAVASVSSDPADYGRIRVLELPDSVSIDGPQQIANQFGTDAGVRGDLLPLVTGGSNVILGNLLTLPVGGGLLYVEPVYVRAKSTNSYPTLQLVLAGFGKRVASAPTLREALDELFGAGAVQTPTDPPPTDAPTGADDVKSAVAAAEAAFRTGQEALKKGDFAAYGAAQKQLQTAIERLARLSGGSASPSPSPSGR
jgi:uncharacterized membrane protein (UPF0182 family)